MTFQKALDLVKEQHSITNPNIGFIKQLISYQENKNKLFDEDLSILPRTRIKSDSDIPSS